MRNYKEGCFSPWYQSYVKNVIIKALRELTRDVLKTPDLNDDGNVNIIDLIMIKREILKKIQ